MAGRSTWLVFLALFSCATSLSPELRRAAAAVRLLDGGPPAGFISLGEVQALSCARRVGSLPDSLAAREELKVEAAKRGATAVASILCREEGVSFGDNCWKSIRCVGDAGKLP
jgi:hypothetical protein